MFELDGGKVKTTRRGYARGGWLLVVVRIRMGEGYKKEGERLCGVTAMVSSNVCLRKYILCVCG